MKKQSSKRLDFIKAAHESEKLEKSARMEDYLEVIGELVDMKGYATTLDISRYMNVSAPSVTKMLKRLDKNGYLYYEKYHGISLTPTGEQLAETIRQKHGTLLDFFEILGIGREIALKLAREKIDIVIEQWKNTLNLQNSYYKLRNYLSNKF